MNEFVKGVESRFPKEILKDSIMIEGNVCACLLQNLTYFDDCGLDSKSFLTSDGKFLFGLGRMLRDKSYVNCDEVSVLSNISENEAFKNRFEEIGWKSIQNMMDCVDIRNWDAYLDALNKRNIMCQLSQSGYNLIDPILLKNAKRIEPYKLFEKYTANEVLDFYENKISTLAINTNSTAIVEQGYIEFDDAFIEHLQNSEEIGVSIGDMGTDVTGKTISTFKFMDNEILGLKNGTLSCLAAHSGTGKTTACATFLYSLIAKNQKIVIVSNEAQLNDMKLCFLELTLTRCLNYWKLPKKKLISGLNFTDEDRKKIKEAQQFWKERYAKSIKMVVLSDMKINLVCNIIKKHILAGGCTAFLVDTFKLSGSSDDSSDQFWLQLVNDSRRLASLALQYQAIGLLTMQLALSTVNRCWLSADCLSNSKGCKEIFSNLIMMRKLADCELDPTSPYFVHPFRSKQKDDGTWYEEPYEPNRAKVFRYVAIDKSRRGPDTNDTGVGYLWRMDGDFCGFYETCKCRATRKILTSDNSR